MSLRTSRQPHVTTSTTSAGRRYYEVTPQAQRQLKASNQDIFPVHLLAPVSSHLIIIPCFPANSTYPRKSITMATNTNNQYHGAIKSDAHDMKNDAYRLKNDVSQYGRQAGRDTRDAAKNTGINTYNRMLEMTNQVVSPQTRQGFYEGVKSFCIEQPYIAVGLPILS